jgi:N-carbamoyl-L-amino-acid hydrolase
MTAREFMKNGNQTDGPRIDSSRLKALLDGVNGFGRNPSTGGYNRIGYSDADMAARAWFAGEMRRSGLAVHCDGAGNVFGRLGRSDAPCVMAGSHLDTVPEGGAFDGALGACIALECARSLIEADIKPEVALVVAATAEEEGRFGGMLGSQAITGQVTRQWLENARDAEGIRLKDAMGGQGLDPYAALECGWERDSIRQFLELHIEQGPVLESMGIPLGIADSVSGVCNLELTFSGTANHSGTTPMDMRTDAFAGLAALASELDQLIDGHGSRNSRMTIGKVTVEPNFPHTIPGRAICVVNIRDTDPGIQRELTGAVKCCAERLAKMRGLDLGIVQQSWLEPVALDAALVGLIREEAEMLGYESLVMPSGAGHDAQTMSTLCPSGLIFVPSRNGISHSPEEFTEWQDIEKGAQLMLTVLMRLLSAEPATAT